MQCVEVSDLQGFLFQKVVECHGEKRRGGEVLLDRLRLLGCQDSSGGLKVHYQSILGDNINDNAR